MLAQADHLLEKFGYGVMPAMATPLDASGYHVVPEAVSALVDFLIGRGVKGIFAGGTTGEGILLDNDQRRLLHELSMQAVAHRVPLLVHVGTNTTRDTRALTEHAAQLGVDGIVCITPTFYGLSEDALLAYFQEIAALAPEIPFLVYDIPQMAVTGISPALLARLIENIPNFAGLKCSRLDAQIIRQLIDVAADRALVFAGNERIGLGSLSLGAIGLISGLATAIPEPFVALTEALASGDLPSAQREQRRVNRLLDLIPPSERIGALKAILQQRGVDAGPTVPPRTLPATSDLWARLSGLL